jgi:hypothetical protein
VPWLGVSHSISNKNAHGHPLFPIRSVQERKVASLGILHAFLGSIDALLLYKPPCDHLLLNHIVQEICASSLPQFHSVVKAVPFFRIPQHLTIKLDIIFVVVRVEASLNNVFNIALGPCISLRFKKRHVLGRGGG